MGKKRRQQVLHILQIWPEFSDGDVMQPQFTGFAIVDVTVRYGKI